MRTYRKECNMNDVAAGRIGTSSFFTVAGPLTSACGAVGVKTIVANEMGNDFLRAYLCLYKHMAI